MKDDISTPTPDSSPNEFETGKAGTPERSRAEAAIEALRQRGGVFVDAVRATRMPMVLTDPNLPDNPIVFANAAFLKLSGYGMEEVLGQHPHFMNGPHTDPGDAARFAEAVRADQDDIIETVQYRKDGSRFVATVLLSAFKDDAGRTLNHFMSFLDVTRRADAEDELARLKTIEAALRESETELAAELKHATLLRDLALRLVPEESLTAIFDEILEAAIAITASDAGTVQIYDPETRSLVLLVTRGFGLKMTDHFKSVDSSSTSACGIALKNNERTFVDFDADASDGIDEACAMHIEAGYRSAQATPLVSRAGNPLGMLNTHWRASKHRPSDRQLRSLDLLARQAADLIERRQAEDSLRASERHAQTLLAELQHRVRNTLAVVRSIARRTAERSPATDEFISHFDGRLNAFARVQSAVTRSAGHGVDLRDIVDDELLAVAAKEGNQLRVHGPPVELTARAAETLGLAIHELATNAVKHGALSSGSGCVRVRWERVQNGAGPELELEWRETGMPVPPTASREGFGHEMLLRSLPYDLGAKSSIHFIQDGIRFNMTMPINTDTVVASE